MEHHGGPLTRHPPTSLARLDTTCRPSRNCQPTARGARTHTPATGARTPRRRQAATETQESHLGAHKSRQKRGWGTCGRGSAADREERPYAMRGGSAGGGAVVKLGQAQPRNWAGGGARAGASSHSKAARDWRKWRQRSTDPVCSFAQSRRSGKCQSVSSQMSRPVRQRCLRRKVDD